MSGESDEGLRKVNVLERQNVGLNQDNADSRYRDDITEIVNGQIDKKIDPIARRLDVFEKTLVECTEKLTKSIEIQNENKAEVRNEISRLASQVKSAKSLGNVEGPDPSQIQQLQKQVKDKDSVICKLQNEIVHLKQENSFIREIMSKEKDTLVKDLKLEIQKLRNDKVNLQKENEQLQLTVQFKEESMENIKLASEERLRDKDKLVENIQDRLQSYLYDAQGGAWSQVNSSHEERSKIEDSENAQENINITREPCLERGKTENSRKDSFEVLMLHDSICRDIDIHRLLQDTGKKGEKVVTYTIPDVLKFCDDKLEHASILILHVGINDLKKNVS